MKKYLKLAFFLLVVPSILLTSCKDEGGDTIVEFDVLKEYLVSTGMDLDHVMKSTDGNKFVMFPADETGLDAKYVIDIRSASDYANGHIDGAVNVALGDILTHADANANGKDIVVVCYTGQTACFATALLRLYDEKYHNTQALKWGMSGWNADFDSWSGNIGDVAEGSSNWTSDAAPANQTFDNPALSTGATTGAEILKARVEAVLAEGFKGVNATDVIASPGNYFINNYFSDEDYTGFGHVAGAYRINPLLLADDTYKGLDANGKVVTYCYTGQTSAVITAFLRVMGYDAYSLKFGMNALYNSHSNWSSNQWGGDSNPKDFSTVK